MNKKNKILLSIGILVIVAAGISIPLAILYPKINYLSIEESEIDNFYAIDVEFDCNIIEKLNGTQYQFRMPQLNMHRYYLGENKIVDGNKYQLYQTDNGTLIAIRYRWIFTNQLMMNNSYHIYGLVGRVVATNEYMIFFHKAI